MTTNDASPLDMVKRLSVEMFKCQPSKLCGVLSGREKTGWTERQAMVRVYHDDPNRDGVAPRTFGPLARFYPHVRDSRQQPRDDPKGRGALYLAADLATALAESYPEQWPDVSICEHTRAAWLRPAKAVSLLDLAGEGALALKVASA
jgi:hypothetical protein